MAIHIRKVREEMGLITDGEIRKSDGTAKRVIMEHSKGSVEIIIVNGTGVIESAYKRDRNDNEWAYQTKDSRKLYKLIKDGLSGCKAKNSYSVPFTLGTSIVYNVNKKGYDFTIEKHNDCICGLEISNDEQYVYMQYRENGKDLIPRDIPYIKLASSSIVYNGSDDMDEQDIPVRTLEEIGLEKDITWLNNKKYYVVNDEATAEQIFQYIENYRGMVSFDTETTGLKINMFGKIGSEKKKYLEEYNKKQIEEKKEPIRVDSLVGIIFCVEKDVSYYFPCGNRKFKNIYSNYNDTMTKKTVQAIKAKYTIGEFRERQDDMAKYIRETPENEISPDVILMERCRKILETCNLLAHNGTFEWKVCWLYNILFNLKDDTMIMHQLMYKFRTTTSNRGEPSNLKYLSKTELGVDQLDLKDFFINYAELGAEVKNGKKKKNKLYIDFSYMDYEGTKAYAPADGDLTLQLGIKYKKDLKENHPELEYLYSVEIVVSQAIAYMEFYGIRIDEEKIENTKQKQITDKMLIEHEIRKIAGVCLDDEEDYINKIKEYTALEKEMRDKNEDKDKINNVVSLRIELQKKLRDMFDSQEDGINLASPAQVADLFYNKLGLPLREEKPSVGKKVLKQYLKLKDDGGNPKYPFVNLYTDWKKLDTLLVKFFDNLPNFMYPGGFMFASFGQISTATGRMSCNKPNLQQLPKDVTAIVVPRPGYVQIDGDFSQIEYRTLVALAPEPDLLEKFKDPDMDYHTTMASLMYGVDYALVTSAMRSDAKSFNFGIPYGMGIGSLAILLTGVNTESTRAIAREKYNLYIKDQPNIQRFFSNTKEGVSVLKYTETKWHRRRSYSFEDKDGNFSQAKKAMALRQGGNAVIQGCLDGDTNIEVNGIGKVAIKNMVNTHVQVWNGNDWTYGDILYSGKKQKCTITFTNGQQFICSPEHRFLVDYNTFEDVSDINPNWREDIEKDGYIGGRFVRCKDLKTGMVININEDASKSCKIKDFDNRFNNVMCIEDDDGFSREYFMDIPCVIVKSIEITDEWIDMYDVCNTDCGYYVADGIITHNTAADIFKIAVARNFNWIKANGLLGDVLITNLIHDEQLLEVNAESLNVQKVLAAFIENMEMELDGFPPLYTGAGVAMDWKDAKGKMAEIHPVLAHQLVEEAKSQPLRLPEGTHQTPDDVIKYFDKKVFEFRRQKIIDYVMNPENNNKVIHPVIGSLLSLQFDYGVTKKFEEMYCNDNYTKDEQEELLSGIPVEQLRLFIEENNLDVDYTLFHQAHKLEEDTEEDDGYEDDEEEEGIGNIDEFYDSDFVLVDEDDKMFGVDLRDVISKFGLMISQEQKVCGIDATSLSYKQLDKLGDYINKKSCNDSEEGAMQVVLLTHSSILTRTDIWVKDIDGFKMNKEVGLNSLLYR